MVLARGGVLADGPPLEAVTARVLPAAFGVEGRIERCSAGYPLVVAERASVD